MTEEQSNKIVEFSNLRDRIRQERQDEAQRSVLRGGDGGGTFDGMEARVAKLEASIQHIQTDVADIKNDVRSLRDNARTDFRILFGAVITVALGLAALMARGFHWL
jgi:hypothetical protein